jgi:protein involved in polysaccharide export with SLBB domain
VRQPGAYPVSKDTSLDSLLAVAGGTTIEANIDNIEVTSRLIPADETSDAMTPTRINVSLSNAEPSTLLVAPGDTVRVNQKFNRVEEQSVTLLGEVKNPGKYDLLPGDTMLSLINRAGGLTDISYPDGVIFSRAAERKQEEARYKAQARDLEMKLAASLQSEDKDKKPDMAQVNAAQGIIAQLQDAKAVGRITVEADPGVLTSDPEQDILLEAGDKIYIPRRPLTVRVGGEVLSPAALQFRKGKDADNYIDEAGGTTYYADRDRAFVVYPDGSAKPLAISAWKQDINMIPPGSTIIVPRDPKPFDFLESAEKISTILANIALTGFYIDDLGDDD